jgi:hypothetical protein
VFHLALLEAWCDEPGQPRLDRAKIEGAGLVLRRLEGDRALAWVKAGTRQFGWETIDPDVDPALDRRALRFSVGHPFINRQLASNRLHRSAGALRLKPEAEVTEQVHPLFVAPPEVCAAAGKTVLFATVPVTALEQAEPLSEAAADRERFPPSPQFGKDPAERAELQGHLVHYLKAGGPKPLPLGSQDIDPSWMNRADASSPDKESGVSGSRLGTFILLLQQLAVEFDAFGDHPQARRLFALLNRITLERDFQVLFERRIERQPAGEFLRRAKSILLDRQDAFLRMPHRWGAVDASLAQDIFAATLACLDHQFKQLRPARGRFDDDAAVYAVRAFIRVKPEHPGCPPQLLWSAYSEPFTIAPWHESGGAPPTTVHLPDLFDRAVLRSLKPNVAFVLPPKLAKLLRADPKALLDGDGSGEGFSIGWICGLSIPIITVCAFIALNIFLGLLNLIFFWLPFFKICIPIPKGKLP